MLPDVIKEMQEEEQSEFLKAMLETTLPLLKKSRQDMSRNYERWDMQDAVYRGEQYEDREDRDAARKGLPTKMVTPNTFAQVMTFTSFLFLMFNQNRTFFELQGIGQEDMGMKKVDSETLLEFNLRRNMWNQVLFQHLLDLSRFGPGILSCNWTRELTHAYVQPDPMMINYNGVEATINQGSDWAEFVRYEGNEVRATSPYRFFPDTSYPLTDFQRGSFCADEDEFTIEELQRLEAAGEVAGVKYIERLPKESVAHTRGKSKTTDWSKFDVGKSECLVLVSKVQRKLIPSKFEINGKPLGPQEFPIIYHVWIANDNRVIRCEPALAWHGQFSWTVSQFTPDMHMTLNYGLADLIYRLQDVINWYVNSHITSVRRVMQNRLVINPQLVETTSLDGEGDIYMRKGINRPVKDGVDQLKVQDVTGGHMGDVDLLSKIMEVVTGVNGNAMGQYNSGRRSAQEARVVTAGAAGRMKMHGHLIFDSAFGPLAKMMLSNLRQSISQEFFTQVIGQGAVEDPTRFQNFIGTPQDVICSNDYFTFDSTLASEKGFIAQSLQELLVAIMGNPVAAQQLDLDPRAVLEEIQHLRGAGPISRFSLSKRVASGMAAPLPPMPVPGPAPAQQA